MKNRNIPFGYQYSQGQIVICPHERDIVIRICNEYISGESLGTIAEHLNKDSIEYVPGVTGWNKARLKRIIEDCRYIGTAQYPIILEKKIYDTMQAIKDERNTLKNCDRKKNIYQINIPVKCPLCESQMKRCNGNRIKSGAQRWICHNHDCKKIVTKADKELMDDITNLLNMIIAKPNMILIPTNFNIELSAEVRRLDNEICKRSENMCADKDALRKAMLRRISLAYRDIPNEIYIAKRLRAEFANAKPLSNFSVDLLHNTVKAIHFHENGAVSIILTNDQEIGKE